MTRGKVYQAFNKRIGSWVKYSVVKGRSRITNVKQSKSLVPFKGVKRKGKSR